MEEEVWEGNGGEGEREERPFNPYETDVVTLKTQTPFLKHSVSCKLECVAEVSVH